VIEKHHGEANFVGDPTRGRTRLGEFPRKKPGSKKTLESLKGSKKSNGPGMFSLTARPPEGQGLDKIPVERSKQRRAALCTKNSGQQEPNQMLSQKLDGEGVLEKIKKNSRVSRRGAQRGGIMGHGGPLTG